MDIESVYNEYFNDVYLYVKSLARDGHAAEEITQETFFKAMKSLKSFDGSKDIRAWLFTIAKNALSDHFRKQNRLAELPEDVSAERGVPLFTDSIADEDEAFIIHKFLHGMSEPYKEVFTLRVFGELSFEKIGILFGKSPGWARTVFHRAKTQIKQFTEESKNE